MSLAPPLQQIIPPTSPSSASRRPAVDRRVIDSAPPDRPSFESSLVEENHSLQRRNPGSGRPQEPSLADEHDLGDDAKKKPEAAAGKGAQASQISAAVPAPRVALSALDVLLSLQASASTTPVTAKPHPSVSPAESSPPGTDAPGARVNDVLPASPAAPLLQGIRKRLTEVATPALADRGPEPTPSIAQSPASARTAQIAALAKTIAANVLPPGEKALQGAPAPSTKTDGTAPLVPQTEQQTHVGAKSVPAAAAQANRGLPFIGKQETSSSPEDASRPPASTKEPAQLIAAAGAGQASPKEAATPFQSPTAPGAAEQAGDLVVARPAVGPPPQGSSAKLPQSDPAVSDASTDKIVTSAKLSLSANAARIEVRLEPPELGKVLVSFRRQDGVIEGIIEVERPEARRALEDVASTVVRQLADAGVEVRRVQVTSHGDTPSGNHHDAAHNGNGYRHRGDPDTPTSDAPADEGAFSDTPSLVDDALDLLV